MPTFGNNNAYKTNPWERPVPSFGNNNVERPGEQMVLAPSAARTASGSGPGLQMGAKSTARLDLAVTAAAGTGPTMTVTIEHSHDGTTWVAHSAFPAVTAAGTVRKVFGGLDNYVRATWTMGGTTPSFTFSVSGDVV
jgi:hypothetical protein